jgi:hypothetical protein
MSEITIGDMLRQVPEGQAQTFECSVREPSEERFLQVWQNWDYRPDRLEWLNAPPLTNAPWLGARRKQRIPVSTLPPPEVKFKGPSDQVVDFYSTSNHAFFISEKLFRLIDEMDPGSLEHIRFEVHSQDGALPFYAVMPCRVLIAIDTGRTTVRIEDENLAGWYSRRVHFPEGIVFDNAALLGMASFSDLDAPGWYWSMDLISEARTRGIRGLYANSVASVNVRQVARL